MAEEAVQTTAKPEPDKKRERLEIIEGGSALRFVLHPPRPMGFWTLVLVAIAFCVFAACFYVGGFGIPVALDDSYFRFRLGGGFVMFGLYTIQAVIILFRVLSPRRFIEFDGSTVLIGRAPLDFGRHTRLEMSDVSNIRYVANWRAAKKGRPGEDKPPTQALTAEPPLRPAGIVCAYRGKPKALLLNLPRETGEAILLEVYSRYPELKPLAEA